MFGIPIIFSFSIIYKIVCVNAIIGHNNEKYLKFSRNLRDSAATIPSEEMNFIQNSEYRTNTNTDISTGTSTSTNTGTSTGTSTNVDITTTSIPDLDALDKQIEDTMEQTKTLNNTDVIAKNSTKSVEQDEEEAKQDKEQGKKRGILDNFSKSVKDKFNDASDKIQNSNITKNVKSAVYTTLIAYNDIVKGYNEAVEQAKKGQVELKEQLQKALAYYKRAKEIYAKGKSTFHNATAAAKDILQDARGAVKVILKKAKDTVKQIQGLAAQTWQHMKSEGKRVAKGWNNFVNAFRFYILPSGKLALLETPANSATTTAVNAQGEGVSIPAGARRFHAKDWALVQI